MIAEDLLIISLPLQRIRLIIIVETKRKNYYVKRLQKERDRKVPEVYFEDLTPSQSNLVLVQTAVELEESISGYFPSSGLSEREIFILMAVYTYGYSVSDIAKYLQVSRQNINQIKKRAENKIRQKLT